MYLYVGFRPDRLFPVKVETWSPFVFVHLDVDPGPFTEQLGDLPQLVGTYATEDLRRVSYKWMYHPCNWKLAANSFVSNYYIPHDLSPRKVASPVSGSSEAAHVMFTVDLPEAHTKVGRSSPLPALRKLVAGSHRIQDPGHKATFCWVFPDLLLALMPDHIVSVVLAPASTRDCLQRLSLFVSAEAGDTPEVNEEIAKLTEFWVEAFSQQAAVGAAAQEEADYWGTPTLPETALPVESNHYFYRFQKYLIDRILTRYPYYGDEIPLYRNPTRSRDAYYGHLNVHFR
jgi:phenylpropionate dioxygenase-like ring-hydroxylating dioxygenase large terminal subunit